MARTIQQIYDSIIFEKESNPALAALSPTAGENATNLLSDLTSNSRVAIWRLLFWITSTAIWALENIFDLFRAEILALSETLVTGTARWYWAKSFEYQHGDVLIWDPVNSRFDYATTNTAIQIIKRAAVIDQPGLLTIKVAKLSGGLPVPLSGPELVSFTYYVNLIKFAGTNINVVSLPADYLKLFLSVVVDPLIIDNSGESISVPGVFPVIDAINNYIQQLPFDGTLNLTQLTDAIQKVPGVINPVIDSAFARPISGSYLAIDKIVGYNAAAGHMVIDPGFPLTTQIQYF